MLNVIQLPTYSYCVKRIAEMMVHNVLEVVMPTESESPHFRNLIKETIISQC